MSDRPWWAHGLQWGLWAVCMSLVMGWLGRSRTRATPTTDPGRLHHPRSTLILAAVCSGFFVVLFLLCAIFGGDQARIAPFFLLFAGLGVPLFFDYVNARHTLRPDGLEYGRMFGGGGVALWCEIRRLRYSTSSKWFRLDTRDGRVARISAMLVGLPEFARAALDHVPADAIDAPTRAILEATARGDLPPVWSS
jgi:PH (Pleckstrin Homology) domain-containing protein